MELFEGRPTSSEAKRDGGIFSKKYNQLKRSFVGPGGQKKNDNRIKRKKNNRKKSFNMPFSFF